MKKYILLILFCISIFSASAKLYSVRATLSGTNEVPTNGSTATGTLNGTFDDVTKILSFNLTFSGLSGSISGSHLHQGAAGGNGPVIINLNVITSPYTFASAPLINSHITALMAGNMYINLHTTAFPGGEIRGQLAVGMEIFNATSINDFNAIGGYSFTQETFPNGPQSNPYVFAGPLPQNSFTYSASAIGGINNVSSSISTSNIYTPITIQFEGNNVRKFGCRAFASILGGGGTTPDIIQLTANTNLGNIAVVNGGTSNLFVGFRVLNENEYIVSIQATFLNITASVIALKNIVVGDDQAQNVALNLDGDNDFVQLPSTVGNFNFNQDFTVAFWVKPNPIQTDITNPDSDIVEKWDNNLATPYPFVIRYFNQTAGADNGKIRFARYDAAGHNPGITSSLTINDGRWHHITAGRETGPDGPVLFLAIDGVNTGGFPLDNTNTTTTNNVPIYVGQRASGINSFKGEIDELRIYIGEEDPFRFCKNPNPIGLQAAYNFNNGVPNGNNTLITQIQDAVGTNHGTLSGFTKTGDVSNFVTGQVKYVNKNAPGANNGNSWVNAFNDLQSALFPNTCNDLVEVFVATSTYRPAQFSTATSFDIPAGMKIYGGFAGTEKNINERNLALIHTTNKTTLSGDLGGNDTPFNFGTNRTDNSLNVVKINGTFITLDGFTVRGGQTNGINKYPSANDKIINCRMVDNVTGLYLNDATSTVSNCMVAGNYINGIYTLNNSTNFENCVIVNNGGKGIFQIAYENEQTKLLNCTIAVNGGNGMANQVDEFFGINQTIQNTIIKDNAGDVVDIDVGVTTNNITYSLVQGFTSGTGNLDGNTTNPQFVSAVASGTKNDLGNYRLKDSSPCINTGTDLGISPLDLDRNPRPRGGKTDMGAYESNVNMNEIISIATGNWESNSTWNLNRVPLATDKVILNNHIVTVTTNTAKAKNVEQKPSSDLKFNTGGSLELNQ